MIPDKRLARKDRLIAQYKEDAATLEVAFHDIDNVKELIGGLSSDADMVIVNGRQMTRAEASAYVADLERQALDTKQTIDDDLFRLNDDRFRLVNELRNGR